MVTSPTLEIFQQNQARIGSPLSGQHSMPIHIEPITTNIPCRTGHMLDSTMRIQPLAEINLLSENMHDTVLSCAIRVQRTSDHAH
jgi:hypothetical protein